MSDRHNYDPELLRKAQEEFEEACGALAVANERVRLAGIRLMDLHRG